MGPALLLALQTTASAAETIVPVQLPLDGRVGLQRRLSAHRADVEQYSVDQVRGELFKRQA